jgi:hypothetical protein
MAAAPVDALSKALAAHNALASGVDIAVALLFAVSL